MSATEYAIGRHCGVTFAGLKIASLVSLRKGEEDVIQTLSRRFAGKGFAFILLREDEERLLVYICHRARLTKYLFSPDVMAFLARFGYEYACAEEALRQLKERMNGEFPHEIGVFLGYPLCDVLLLGCPAMGNEELEPEEFEPFFAAIESSLSGRKIGLFGSYDWGDGEWMRTWQQRVEAAGGVMIDDGLICNNTPDDDALSACRALGEKAAK